MFTLPSWDMWEPKEMAIEACEGWKCLGEESQGQTASNPEGGLHLVCASGPLTLPSFFLAAPFQSLCLLWAQRLSALGVFPVSH